MIRQFACAGAAVLALAACSSEKEELRGTIGFVKGFLGGVAADEPQAAVIGRDVLSAGGSAVDAAVATYFALSVTLPSSAGLGGGGVCVAFDHKTGKTEALDFRAFGPKEPVKVGDRPSAIPANPRGFFALHSRYGRLKWNQLVGPAENLARFGVPVSRAFARDLAAVGAALIVDPETRRVFGSRSGGVLQEGDILRQVDLAAYLGRIRTQGPGDLYVGTMASQFVDAATQAGGTASVNDMRATVPAWRETVRVKFGNNSAHFAALPAGGPLAAQIWGMLAGKDRFADADPIGRFHLLADSAMLAYSDRARWMNADGSLAVAAGDVASAARIADLAGRLDPTRHLGADRLPATPAARPENPLATSFVALDRDNNAVACAVSMNYPFGIGRIAPGTGILLAAQPGPGGRGADALAPMLVVNENVKEFFFAGAASGGAAAPTALTQVAARALLANQALEDAMVAPRVHHSGAPDQTFYEPSLPAEVVAALGAKGHTMTPAEQIGRVNAIACSKGVPPHPESCMVRSDPRGAGLSLSAD